MQPPLLIKNFNHHPIHGTDWEVYNFWPCWYVVKRMQLLNTYISFFPKEPVALEIKFFKWKFGPTCSLKTQLSLTTIESPNIHSHHASCELEELIVTKILIILHLISKSIFRLRARWASPLPFFHNGYSTSVCLLDPWQITGTHIHIFFRQISGNLSFSWARQRF